MKEATKRSILRWIHIVFAIPIAGYVYSPFQELPNYAPVVRFVAVPMIVLTGLKVDLELARDDARNVEYPEFERASAR